MNSSPVLHRAAVSSLLNAWVGWLILGWAASVLAAEAPLRRVGFLRLEVAQTGVNFSNTVPASRHLTNQLLLDGSGVTLADVDGDGRLDVFFGAAGGRSSLWRNRGDWRFE
ncbi:MAG: hypothetical protein RJB04_233, partial [Verrucomicrobiota bacterium]